MARFSMEILIQNRLLHFPVSNGSPRVILQISAGGKVVREFAIELAENEPVDWWAFYDMTEFAGQTVTVAASGSVNQNFTLPGAAQSDFRTARDLLDRISGGAGPRGVKAVAPVGTERIRIEVPEEVDEVSLLGEKLSVVRFEGTQTYTFTGPSRPIALVSNFSIQYTPARKPPAKKAPARKK